MARSRTRLAGLATATALLGASLLGAGLLGLSATAQPASRLLAGYSVGALGLHPCQVGGRDGLCGHLRVPLDYVHPAAAHISIHFGWLPAGDGASVRPGTVVAQEGGPGYPSTGTASEYVAMLGPILETENLLVMDQRGTGGSALIDCRPLQTLGNVTTTPAFRRAVADCGRQLNHTYRGPGGGFVPAADLFSTANSVRDLHALLVALHTGPVDLYGDSYGTYFAQAFLSRFGSMLRSVTLDSAYEARDLDPWYMTSVDAAHRGFDAVCAQAAGCEQAAPGSAWSRSGRHAAALRRHPVAGRTTGVTGKPVHVVVDETALVNIVNDAGYDPDPYRQLDAATRALLRGHDSRPLLRLWAQDLGWDDSDYVAPAASYSDGQYLAVACTDYPQLFDLRAAQSQRRHQLDRSVRGLDPSTFAPFTTREWMSMQPYTETYSGCLTWPRPAHREDPPVARGPLDPAHVPVLVLNGSLDSLTPAAGGAHVARQIGPDARQVVVPHMVHLVGLDDRYGCGASLVRHFIADPSTLHRMDVSCRAHVPEVHAVGRYPSTLDQALPARGPAPLDVRRLAAGAAAAAGDAAVRFGYVDGFHDRGLRGGTVDFSRLGHGLVEVPPSGVRWTTDTSVAGTVTFNGHGLAAWHARPPLSSRPLDAGRRWQSSGTLSARAQERRCARVVSC